MFPIVHYYVNIHNFGTVPHLMALGGLYPDLASAMGVNRNYAHQMGIPFYEYCQEQAPDALPLALGIISHGINPHCVDYYADEHWPNCEKGWCFEEGRNWLDRIAAVTTLPEEFLWWKSHNFVEIACEVLTITANPGLNTEIITAINDNKALSYAARVLADFTGCNANKCIEIFQRTPHIFALQSVDPFSLAEKQAQSFASRHNVHGCNIKGMAELIEDISASLKDSYPPYMQQSMALVKENMLPYI